MGQPTREDFQQNDQQVPDKILRRRQADQERLKRFMNQKTRTIGVDKEYLDRQVAEREAQLHQHDGDKADEQEQTKQICQHLNLLEMERHRLGKQREVQVQSENTQQKPELRKEWFLSDPKQLQKEQPTRMGDVDPRLGVSSAQIFEGEDLHFKERTKQQQQVQRTQLDEQVKVRAQQNDPDKILDQEYQKTVEQMVNFRQELEQEEQRLRKEINCRSLEHNKVLMMHKDQTRSENLRNQGRTEEERRQDLQEGQFIQENKFLNESEPGFLESGRIRRDHFKGLSKEVYVQQTQDLDQQIQSRAMNETQVKNQDLQFDNDQEMQRKQLVQLEYDKNKRQKQIQQEQLQLNDKLKELKMHESTINFGTVKQDEQHFYKGFGTSCR